MSSTTQFNQEDVTNIVKFLNNDSQKGIFVLDEYVVVGQFWESLKKNIKDEDFDLDVKSLDLLVKILNVCLTRKGNEPDVLRVILSLLDKADSVLKQKKEVDEEITTV